MVAIVDKYKALPQKAKNYIQLGGLGVALVGIYYRDPIMDRIDPGRRYARETGHSAASDAARRTRA